MRENLPPPKDKFYIMLQTIVKPQANEMLCSGLIQANCFNLVFAKSGVGKTLLCYALAEKMQKEDQKNVCYLDFETDEGEAIKKGMNECTFDLFCAETLAVLTERLGEGLTIEFLLKTFIPEYLSYFKYIPKEDIQNAFDCDVSTISNEDMSKTIISYFNDKREEMRRTNFSEVSQNENGYDVIFIDNLTFFCNDLVEAKEMREVVKNLNNYARRYHKTIIGVLHSRKSSAYTGTDNILSFEQISGSANISNFTKNIIGLGKIGATTYLKHCKAKSNKIFDTENVGILAIKESPFLHMDITGTANEYSLINNAKKYNILEEVQRLQQEGQTQQQIARNLGVSQSKISRLMKGMKANEYGISPIQPELTLITPDFVPNCNEYTTTGEQLAKEEELPL